MFLKWSHAANSLEKVTDAINDPTISAIECDVVLGVAKEGRTTFYETPILAHPPHRESNISVATLLLCITQKEDDGTRVLQKHLKLDFKEIDVVEPSLELLEMLDPCNPLGKQIFLNADIFAGPGMRGKDHVPPELFIENCLEHINACREKELLYSLSLGYKCNWVCGEPYQETDVVKMDDLTTKYNLAGNSKIGLVLALNARLLSAKPEAFDQFLQKFPRSTILAWTGNGEPSIPQDVLNKIKSYFVAAGMYDRIDFDCDVQAQQVTNLEGCSCEKVLQGWSTRPCFWLGVGLVAGISIGIALSRRK